MQSAVRPLCSADAVGRETLAVGYVHDIGAVLGQLLFDAGESLSERERLELAAQRIGQRAALGQQFERHVGHLAALYLTINEYVVHRYSRI